jgi:hypothetical protein
VDTKAKRKASANSKLELAHCELNFLSIVFRTDEVLFQKQLAREHDYVNGLSEATKQNFIIP